MKTIGVLGGMSWESSLEYYRIMNETVSSKLGGLHSARILLYSYDFHDIDILQHQGEWQKLKRMLASQAQQLEQAGAEIMVIATNTMHIAAEEVEAGITVPLLHIADVTAEEIMKKNIKSIALLGTRFTMEGNFYRKRLLEKFNIHTLTPDDSSRSVIHTAIYEELCQGIIKNSTRKKFQGIIEELIHRGAEGVILGCTEIPLLIQQKHVRIPLFDTTRIHAAAAAEAAISSKAIS